MNSLPSNRDTLFNMKGLRGSEQFQSIPEPDGSRPQRTLQKQASLGRDAPSSKRPPSPPKSIVNAKSRTRQDEYDGTKNESPWNTYKKRFEVKLDRWVIVADRRGSVRNRVVVKSFSGQDSYNELRMLHHIRHDNFVTVLESFHFEGLIYAVLERMPISLVQVVASPPYPGEQELAAIVGQLVEGLSYLAVQGMEHRSLNCSCILLSAAGDVKISRSQSHLIVYSLINVTANQECCREVSSPGGTGTRDVEALGRIMMELMQKYTKEDGAVGIEDLERWPSDCDAVGFLSLTTSAGSVHELKDHPLLQCAWQKNWLEWLVDWAGVSAYQLHRTLK